MTKPRISPSRVTTCALLLVALWAPTAIAQVYTVDIVGLAFDPADLTIEVGDTVTWTNDDPGMLHTITAVDGSFDSGFLNDGDTWSYTFAEPGEFEYFCTPHPWMRAKVIVEG